jgi:hypothetical protein
MAANDSKLERLPTRKDRFATTHWSIVVSAGCGRSSEAIRTDINRQVLADPVCEAMGKGGTK